MKHLTIFFLAIFFLFDAGHSQTLHSISSIPNPKYTSEADYVSNPDNILSHETVQAVNLLLKTLEDTTTSEVAVVVVNSIGDKVPKDFATELFNTWGIGKKENDNGLLIFLVIDQRRIEFETGFGIEPILPDAICKRIQVETMIPFAKESNYDGAILAGVQEVIKIMLDPIYREEITAESNTIYAEKPFYRQPANVVVLGVIAGLYLLFTGGTYKNLTKNLKKKPSYIKNNFSPSYMQAKYFFLNMLAPAAVTFQQMLSDSFRIGEFIVFVYGFIAVLLLEKRLRFDAYLRKETKDKTAYEKYNLYSSSYKGWGAAAFFIPLPFLITWFNNNFRKKSLRNTPPVVACGEMIRLDEISDDAYLEAFQITEETIKTVDYDVWKCKNSDEYTILRYPNNQTKHTTCPNCGAIAFFVSEKHTLMSPTYSSSGKGEKIYLCKHCLHKKSETYSIPKLTRSSSSSGGSGYSGGGGGGSFGGGSSGGGGAGSSW
ncbi:MAG: TPM domain-containing protein [Chitinophagales bacterium]